MLTQSKNRGFTRLEYEQRLERLRQRMQTQQLDAVLVTTEPQFRYFSGFRSQFWQSLTRPWFLLLPLSRDPIAVIPAIGASGMGDTWIEDIRTWPAPQPQDDGISLLTAACRELATRFGRIGIPLGQESYLRMPVNDYQALCKQIQPIQMVDVALLMHQLLSIKSKHEIDKIRHACVQTSQSFNDLPNYVCYGDSQRDICRKMRLDLIQRGADDIPYMIAGSGAGGYDSIIMGPSDETPVTGDVLIIDTGAVFDGYFCDFDRNFGFVSICDQAKQAYATIWQATQAAFIAAKPGATTADLFHTMWQVLESGGALANDVGRMGHGLGMGLTEWPSLTATDNTILEPGMVLTLEPGMNYAPGKQMVHEENIVITQDAAQWLTLRAATEMPLIV